MDKEIQMITSYLDKIAAKIGVGAQKIWPWLVKQQYIEAIYPIVLFLFFCIVTMFSAKWFGRELKKWEVKKETDRYNADESMKNLTLVVSIIFAAAAAVSFCVFLGEFQDIFNAQYWALKDLLSQVK
jgi:ABC-type Fe3+ transport system permease subunit